MVIGGFAGCFAGLAGWTAAVNTVSLMPLLVAMLDFLWTPGHLWGLAIKKVKEYKSAGIPMLPVKVGMARASQVVFWLNVLTVAFSFLFSTFTLNGLIYLALQRLPEVPFCFKIEVYFFQVKKRTLSKSFLLQFPI